MPIPHVPVMPNKPTENNAQRMSTDAAANQAPAPKSAIASMGGQSKMEHLTREIVHDIISKRIKLFLGTDSVHELLTDRIKSLVDEMISTRNENFIDAETAKELVDKRTNHLTDRGAVQKIITARIEPLIERATVHRLFGERLANKVDLKTVRNIVSKRSPIQTAVRPASWEDDISANTLDEEPFETLPSPSSREIDRFVEAANDHGDRETLAQANISEMVAKDTLPIPVPTDRESYFPGFDEKYWLFGLADYLKVMQVAAKYDVQPKSVLDFGCASGRVLRHFAAQTNIKNIWGSDINRRHIRWLYEHMPMHVRPVFNHCIPSLPIPDASIDVITAFSVFTHIDTFEIHWLAELSRILSDGGICYLTVHNEATWELLAGEENNPKNRLLQSIIGIDPKVRDQLNKPMPGDRLVYRFADQGPYRAQVFLSNRHLETVWGRFFSIEEIIPGHHQRQTVVVLKKRRA